MLWLPCQPAALFTLVLLLLTPGPVLTWPQQEDAAFVFPDAVTPAPPPGNNNNNSSSLGLRGGLQPPQPPPTNTTPVCSTAEQMVWFARSDQCEVLLSQGPCENGEWLVMAAENNSSNSGGSASPQCKPNPCAAPLIPFRGTCRAQNDPEPCPRGMGVEVTATGEGECDCLPGTVFWHQKGECHPLFLRGPCPAGQHLILRPSRSDRDRREPTCAINTCRNGEVLLRRACVTLNSPEGPCSRVVHGGALAVDPNTMSLACISLVPPRALIDAPLLRCAPGSRRDANGKCRRSL